MYRFPATTLAVLLVAASISGCGGNAGATPTAAPDGAGAAPAKFQRIADGVIVDVGGTAKQIRLKVVDDRIIHVTAIPAGNFDLPKSLMAVKTGGDTHFSVGSDAGHVRLKTTAITADVATASGIVQFLDRNGKVILGEHQEGTMNYKGRDVELAQHNMDIGIPFVVSSRRYGLLWDNNSITRFGDPRPYRMIDKQLKLFDADGKPGGFTANYYVDGKLKLSRVEAEVDYQYLKDLKRWPAQLTDAKGITGGPGQTVEWKGSVSSDVAGLHKFRLYASGYFKLYVDGKLVLDDWRQNWNPWYRDFFVPMRPGEKHAIRIEWTPQSGYIALDHQDPLPAAEQSELSLFSELGHAVDYYFIGGDNLDEVIAGYREVTG